jgi:integral membrane protein
MKQLFTSNLGRLRLIGLLEGISLLLLLGIAVPAKHLYGNPALVQSIGLIHGMLFLLFVLNTLSVGIEQRWKFKTTTWKLLIACLIPFGTFYIDKKILSKIKRLD